MKKFPRYKTARLEGTAHATVSVLRDVLSKELGASLTFSETVDRAARESLEKRGHKVEDGIIKPWRD